MASPAYAEVPVASGAGPESRSSAPAGSADAVLLGVLVLLGIGLRLRVAHQSLFADELSTYWISATHSLGGVVSLMYGTAHIPHAEITPPLYFLAAWLTSQLGHAPELLRLPSLLAGTLTIPLVYGVGRRTVGRPAALLAAALTTLSPFMIYYSAEARSYAVMMCLVTLSTLALLLALDDGRMRWWALYALAEAAAFLTHYTCIFALAAQLLWLLWVRPDARRPALWSTLGAIVLLLPWTTGFVNDYNSPTTVILSALSPFTFTDIRLSLEHWAIGFPYVVAGGLGALPGIPALLLLAGAGLLTLAGLGSRLLGRAARPLAAGVGSRPVLILLLLASVPAGEAVQSAFSTHTFGVRNLAAAWPALVLACSALAVASGPRVRVVVASLAILAFVIPAIEMLSARWARPDFRAGAQFIERHSRPGDVVVDATGVLSPGPLTGLDLVLRPPGPVLRAEAPQQRDHPFGFLDLITTPGDAVRRAVAMARGHTIFVARFLHRISEPFPAPYHLLETRSLHDFVQLEVEVWGTGRTALR